MTYITRKHRFQAAIKQDPLLPQWPQKHSHITSPCFFSFSFFFLLIIKLWVIGQAWEFYNISCFTGGNIKAIFSIFRGTFSLTSSDMRVNYGGDLDSRSVRKGWAPLKSVVLQPIAQQRPVMSGYDLPAVTHSQYTCNMATYTCTVTLAAGPCPNRAPFLFWHYTPKALKPMMRKATEAKRTSEAANRRTPTNHKHKRRNKGLAAVVTLSFQSGKGKGKRREFDPGTGGDRFDCYGPHGRFIVCEKYILIATGSESLVGASQAAPLDIINLCWRKFIYPGKNAGFK